VRGVIYVAYGKQAIAEAKESIRTLREHNELPIAVIGEEPIDGVQHVYVKQLDGGGRLAKLHMDTLSPFDPTLYLDADTRVHSNIANGFSVLDEGWDMAMAFSTRQGSDVMGHLPLQDRRFTVDILGPDCLALQAGVMFWRKCQAVRSLFARWREEWAIFKSFDQGALLRALMETPVKLWLLGRPWNTMPNDQEAIVEHMFGRARAR